MSGPSQWSGWVRDYRLLIFDWDGTLVDSIGRIVASLRYAAGMCDLPQLDDEQLKGIIGLGMLEAIDCLYPGLRATPEVDCFRRAYGDHYLQLEQEPSALFPGVLEALDAFRAEGYQLAVATGKSRRGLNAVLTGRDWLDYFDVTRCADETASKPDPLMLREILAHCRVNSEQALMVGDSVFDLQMARHAAVHSVAVGYGAQSLATLKAESPMLSIEHFDELRAWLGQRADQH